MFLFNECECFDLNVKFKGLGKCVKEGFVIKESIL